jgi:DNA-directed RNA polymerase subunit L
MNPSLTNILEEDNDTLKFTLSGINVSLANSIRRTILSDIPVVSIYTQTYKDNECNIEINNTRLHNEILKQRLSCIPIHIKNLEVLPGNYVLEVDKENNSDSVVYVTTEDFKIKNKNNDNYLTEAETRKIFPPNSKTNMFIDFARLRAKVSDTIPGERIKLTSEFSVHSAKEDSMYNVVSRCSYGNTIDMKKVNKLWDETEKKLKNEGMTEKEVSFQKRNFYLLDAQKSYLENSYDYVIQTIGIYDNRELLLKACEILKSKFELLVTNIESGILTITPSLVTMENSFDIILDDEDYTIGKVLEYVLYDKYYVNEKSVVFCGFKKFHPHDDNSKIRLAFKEKVDKQMIGEYLRKACVDIIEVYNKIYNLIN